MVKHTLGFFPIYSGDSAMEGITYHSVIMGAEVPGGTLFKVFDSVITRDGKLFPNDVDHFMIPGVFMKQEEDGSINLYSQEGTKIDRDKFNLFLEKDMKREMAKAERPPIPEEEEKLSTSYELETVKEPEEDAEEEEIVEPKIKEDDDDISIQDCVRHEDADKLRAFVEDSEEEGDDEEEDEGEEEEEYIEEAQEDEVEIQTDNLKEVQEREAETRRELARQINEAKKQAEAEQPKQHHGRPIVTADQKPQRQNENYQKRDRDIPAHKRNIQGEQRDDFEQRGRNKKFKFKKRNNKYQSNFEDVSADELMEMYDSYKK